jgi:hypothetical protein
MAFPYSLYRGISQPQQNIPIDRRDLLNYTGDNSIQSARYINPITQDFEVSSTNHFQGMNAVEQSVRLAIITTFNSSAQLGFGQNFRSIKVITPFIKNKIISVINNALNFQIQNNQIVIGTIVFSNNQNGQISVQFTYTNLTLGNEANLSFII